MSGFKLLFLFANLLVSLASFWRARRERQEGRQEARADMEEVADAKTREALRARARRRALDADPERLREDDGFRRD